MDNILELDSGISETLQKPETALEWYSQLLEAITEDLLTLDQVEALAIDPMTFLITYTGDLEIATEIYEIIVKSFFTSSLATQEKTKDRRQVINDAALSALDDALFRGNISAVDLSIIYKNTNKEK
jgi:hypothetical protein